MTEAFIHEDFLLETGAARELYHTYAAAMPILDYHCHLNPREIAEDRRWENLTQIWLAGDHYKWRAMRTNGVAEHYCTGDAPDREKFQKWAETMPYALRNPLYHWTHLELARYFGVSDLLSPATAERIWAIGCERLAEPDLSARGLMRMSGVRLVCTTDDPVDDLCHHRAIAADPSFEIRVLPTWRPDKGLAVESPEAFNAWVDRLAQAANVEIRDFASYLEALYARHAFFHEAGCRVSDLGLDTAYAEDYTEPEIAALFSKVRGGKALTGDETDRFKSAMLVEFGRMDHARGWVRQLHLGPLRNTNTRMLRQAGVDAGFDSIGDREMARPLTRMLDRLDRTNQLAPTILYNLNPRDNALMATLIGNFQDGSRPGKMQWGSGWWFLDQKDGMERHLETLSQLGLLSRFVGMLTDSRSFLSYTRHEYFRRILCNLLGHDIRKGLIPRDLPWIGAMVQDICYRNAVRYFGFDLPVE
jgi:glucuronate isomerase